MLDPSAIREKSCELGFTACGFARPEPLPMDGLLDKWIANSFHGQMHYMEENRDLRLDPDKLFPGVKTIIPLLASYYREEYKPSEELKISRYAVGRDYHKVLKKRGQALIDWMGEKVPGMRARIFVDSAPVMEKEWARRAGLGWIGKNSCLIVPGQGSWFFIAIIMTDLELTPDLPENRNLCGNCSRCIDVCPTHAIMEDGIIDAQKCISYLTIELKGKIPDEFAGQTDNWLFGCDRCQEVCPSNRFAKESSIRDFEPRPVIKSMTRQIFNQMDQKCFSQEFYGTALTRAGLDKLRQTISFLHPDD